MAKKNLSLLKFTPMEIVWIDACIPDDAKAWYEDREVSEIKRGIEIHTLGYLHSYDGEKDVIRICRGYCPDDSQQEGLFDIALGCIKDIKILKGIRRKDNGKEKT